MLVSDDFVLLIVFLDFDCYFVKVVGEFVQKDVFGNFVDHIEEFDGHSCQDLFVWVATFEGLFFGDFLDLFFGKASFSDDRADSDIGVDEVDSGVSFRIEHLLEIENIVGSSVLFQVIILD